ncbi:fungal-specific transcription factor domain-containing protein [Aspergillus pseudocaelatus]|uniref:Fungal-specific transcription factor domain-containing protein n=1 Tax=Aspergillus pseudocaelatus TaxID=1825620 RepID=A0ABQ6X0P5_9EURO|nr:fungal-specific transcription factor domain-containing protein [Aspergillus pseudocaelatus]
MGERKHRYTTFAGCWTCKARKVKCDENPLGCASCLRLGLTCGGYDIQLQWISSDAGRRPHRDFSARIGRRRIGAVSHPGNPYRSLYAPAALEGSLYFESGLFNAAPNIGLCIFHSLMSTSAFHLHQCYDSNTEYHHLGITHRQLALESLRMVLRNEVPLFDYKTLLVALLSMITIGVIEGSIVDFRVHLQGIANFQGPRRKWQLISGDTRQLNTQSAFLNLLARTTSRCTPSPWGASRELRHMEHDSLTTRDSRSYCYEFTYGITADIAAAIQDITDLYECLEFYRQAQGPIPDDFLEACEDLGDRLLSWTLTSDKVPSFNDRGIDEFDIFKHHSHAWHGAALIFYLNRIQGVNAQDLVQEVATVASHMLAVEEIKSRHVANQMAPISWPAFIASCCALDREPWETWWLDVQKYGIGSIRRQYSIVREIWSEMDTHPSEGWLQILHRRNIQVLAA